MLNYYQPAVNFYKVVSFINLWLAPLVRIQHWHTRYTVLVSETADFQWQLFKLNTKTNKSLLLFVITDKYITRHLFFENDIFEMMAAISYLKHFSSPHTLYNFPLNGVKIAFEIWGGGGWSSGWYWTLYWH